MQPLLPHGDAVAMNNTPQLFTRFRPFGVVVSLVAGMSLVVGSSSASAAAGEHASINASASAKRSAIGHPASIAGKRKPRIVVLSKSPENPVAGQTFTLEFVVEQAGQRLPMADFGCYARTEKILLLPLLEEVGDGTVAHCTWSIPLKAQGHTMHGMVAVVLSDVLRTYLGFEYPIS